MIDFDKIEELIAVELQSIIQSDADYFSGYEFNITNEQKFIRDNNGNNIFKNASKQIFIVLKTYPATLNFGQTLMPIQLDVISEKNKLDVAKRLLLLFAETFNLEFNNDMTIKQYYQPPSVLSNFNEVGNGFRSLLTMRGTLQISENANFIKDLFLIDGTSEIKVDIITSNVNYDIQLDTQSLYNQSSQTKSWGRVGTLVLNFSVYLTDNKICNTALYMMNADEEEVPDGVNTDFSFKIVFKNGITINAVMKMANAGLQQNIGEIPVINFTFTK